MFSCCEKKYTNPLLVQRRIDHSGDREFSNMSPQSPYCTVRIETEAASKALIGRSISCKGIYELWGSGTTYEELHADVRERTASRWAEYSSCTFRFDMDTYQGTRSAVEQTKLFESFSYFGFDGRIKMRDPEHIFCIFEDYGFRAKVPKRVYLGRWISGSQRQAIWEYSLKRRQYISTTSMDSELALLTANLSLAAPGKIFYDPFVGTGSFPIACSHFGTMTMGSDIDSRMVRGKNGVDILSNFRQYNLLDRYLDSFISDLTHSPIRMGRFLDGIICDPPYGVREGLKVLGNRDASNKEVICVDGKAIHL